MVVYIIDILHPKQLGTAPSRALTRRSRRGDGCFQGTTANDYELPGFWA